MNQLKELMSKHNLTQTDLSNNTGVPQPTINRFLQGKTKSPSYDMTRKIARFFGVSVDYLHGHGTVADKPTLREE